MKNKLLTSYLLMVLLKPLGSPWNNISWKLSEKTNPEEQESILSDIV